MTRTKTELVREAMRELGPEARFAAVRAHVQSKYGTSVPESVFYKERQRNLMANRPASPRPEPTPPAPPAQPEPRPESPRVTSISVMELPGLIQSVRGLGKVFGGKDGLKGFIDSVLD
jgi:hypothetical protein